MILFYREIDKSCEVPGFFQAVEAAALNHCAEELVCALVAPLVHLGKHFWNFWKTEAAFPPLEG